MKFSTYEIHFDEAYLFGSIIKPYRFSRASDIDIGFVGLRDEDFFKAMAFISREIGLDVDVIQLEGDKLEDKVKKGGMKWTRGVSREASPIKCSLSGSRLGKPDGFPLSNNKNSLRASPSLELF